MKKAILLATILICSITISAQINTDRVVIIGRNALYFEDYVLAIQYFNQAIKAKSHLAEPYYYRAIAKFYLDDAKGAEDDCTLALERNPFMVRAYQLRGDARQNQEKYDDALADYTRALQSYPNDKFTLVNMGIVNIQRKDFEDAQENLKTLLRIYPSYTQGYLVEGLMYQEKGDTLQAIQNYSKAIEMDKYLPQSYSMRGILYYSQNQFDKALADFDEAIRLEPLQYGNYINRGLVKYSQNDLRGAMADYDKVIDLDNNNIIARFNRGLLRSQVGDDNNAITDFDVVLSFEPDNYIAYLNRSILKNNIGDRKGALADLNKVLEKYPDFYQGFYMRSEIKRQQNDLQGAERDFNYARNQESLIRKKIASGQEKEEDSEKAKTREKSDKNIDKFNLLMVADKSDEEKSKFDNKTRGRIQNRQIKIEPQPRFIVSYYEKANEMQNSVYFSLLIDQMNKKEVLPRKLLLTNSEAPLNELQVKEHFESIDDLSKRLEEKPSADLYFGRALDYMLVQDFTNSVEDFKKAIELNPQFSLAYFDQAVVYTKLLELKENATDYDKNPDQLDLSNANADKNKQSSGLGLNNIAPDRLEYDAIVKNYGKIIELNPEFIYAYYNRAEIRFRQQDFRAAILDYNEAIRRDPEFAEAYYNRGLARFYIKDVERALEDMRKAGELGIVEAYSIIKRLTE